MKKLMVVAAAVLGAMASWGGVKLAEGGKPLAQIVIGEYPTKAAQFGASDLKWHLKQVTGADFEIVTADKAGAGFKILVGDSAFTRNRSAALVGQQYVVDVRADAIELVGRDMQDFTKVKGVYEQDGMVRAGGLPGLFDEQGSMYAVYEFLEKQVGVIWADAYDTGTLCPSKPTLEVETGYRLYEPFMAYRGGTVEYGPDPMLWKGNTPEAKELRALCFKDPKAWRERFRLFQARQRVGGEKAGANHSFYWYYERFLYEDAKNFESKHPEYFAQGYDGEPPQLCFLNPGVIAQTVKDIRAYLDHGGYTNKYRNVGSVGPQWGKNRYVLEPQDNPGFCKCPLCTPYYEPARKKENSQHSTYWYTFVAAVAKEIKNSHPTAKIGTLAYMSHEGLPKGVKLPDNVEVYFCVSGNRESPRGALCKAQMKRMEEWHRAYPNMRLGLWLYDGFPLEFAHNGNYQCVPGYFAHENAKQYKFFKQMNARVGNCNCGMTGEVCQFMSYALMREPELDADFLLDRYFSQYGAAAKPLRAFYDLVEERYCNLKYRPTGVSDRSTASHWQHRCPPEVMAKLSACMEEAKRLAATPEEKTRVAIFELGQWKWMKKGSDSFLERMRSPMPEWTASRIADAGGEIDKVDWEKLPLVKAPIYERGGTVEKPDLIKFEGRFAHDGKYFYMELVQVRDLSKLHISGGVNPFDDWEVIVSRQRAQPYRCYFVDPDNRVLGSSWGEVNWRQGVSSMETLKDKAYFAKVKSVLQQPDRWVERFAFPLEHLADKPLKPGETFYLNPVTVLNPKAGGNHPYGIFSPVSYSTVHTVDRSAAVTLEK